MQAFEPLDDWRTGFGEVSADLRRSVRTGYGPMPSEAGLVLATVRGALKNLADDMDDLPALVRLASRLEPGFRRQFLLAARAANGRIDLEALAAALASGQVGAVEAAAQIEVFSAELGTLAPLLRRGFLLGAAVAHDGLQRAGLAMRFDLVNPYAVTWTEAHAAELVTGVTAETREAIRRLVERAFREGRDVRETARAIRDIVGLTGRQATAVDNFYERLIAEGVPVDRAAARAGKYAEAQLRWRASNLSRTEVIDASAEGQQTLWREARTQGLLDPARTRRIWLVSRDGRLDLEICEPMDGQEVGLEEPFTTGDGRRIMRPTAHPS